MGGCTRQSCRALSPEESKINFGRAADPKGKTTLNSTLDIALSLRAEGIACIPVRNDKVPVIKSWRRFIEEIPTEEESRDFFKNGAAVALVAGTVNCIDVDEKYQPGLMAEYEKRCKEAGLSAVWDRILIQKTPSGGFHLIFRCEGEPIRNMKLAQKAAEENHDTLIETRGKGGYFLIAPSQGYEVAQGDFEMLPVLTEEERSDLLDVARTFNARSPREAIQPSKLSDISPGDDYDQRGDVTSLLQSHGWVQTDDVHWRRPGKDRGISASFGVIPNCFWVFSTSTAFESEKLYKPYAVYAILEHGGDFSAAMRALRALGYGSQSKPEPPDPLKSLERAQEAKSVEEQQAEEDALLNRLAAVEFRPGPEPEDERCLYKLAGIEIAHVGNHLTVIAPAKSGKSAWIGAVIASACPCTSKVDLLGLEPTNRERSAIIHIDTEQSRNDHHRLITRSLKRAGCKKAPDYLLSFCMAGWDPREICQAIDYLAKRAAEAFGGVHAIIVDGIADLITSPNDEEESNALERWFRNLAINFQCCCIGVIHQNPNSDKSRGHLGSQFERKSETVLMLEKKKEQTIVYSTRTRRAPILKEEAPCFEWSDEIKAHVSCDNLISNKEVKSKNLSASDRFDKAVSYLRGLIESDVWEVHELHSILKSKFDLGDNNRRKAISMASESSRGTDRVKPKAGRTSPWLVGPIDKVAEKRVRMEQEYEEKRQGEIKI